jgi:hypothetical protein
MGRSARAGSDRGLPKPPPSSYTLPLISRWSPSPPPSPAEFERGSPTPVPAETFTILPPLSLAEFERSTPAKSPCPRHLTRLPPSLSFDPCESGQPETYSYPSKTLLRTRHSYTSYRPEEDVRHCRDAHPPLTHLRLPGYGKRKRRLPAQPRRTRTEHFSTANLSPTASGSAAAAAYPTDLRVTRTRTEHGCFGYIWLSTLPRKTVAQCCESTSSGLGDPSRGDRCPNRSDTA